DVCSSDLAPAGHRVRARGPRGPRAHPGAAARAERARGDGRLPRPRHRRAPHRRRERRHGARLHRRAGTAGGLMKLHHLRMTGISPFAGTVESDLSAPGASGMLLLEGPTGSGRATSADRIRSQFAPPAEASVVDLIFETASGIHRVRRSPEYQRPKLRGTGTTKEQAKAVLWRIGSPQLIEDVIADTAGGGSG